MAMKERRRRVAAEDEENGSILILNKEHKNVYCSVVK